MFLPRSLISTLYLHLKNTRHTLSPPVLILVSLDPDALCACRILTHLLKRDYIPHKIQPIAGYADLELVGHDHVKPMMESQGGSGGVVVCLGVGGLVDLASLMGLEDEEDAPVGLGGVEVWVIDARRPWNLGNVFGVPHDLDEAGAPTRQQPGVEDGRIGRDYKPGRGGIIVFDDGDIEEELQAERSAYLALVDMPVVEDESDDSDDDDLLEDREKRKSGESSEDRQRRRINSESDEEPEVRTGQKRKARSDSEESNEDHRQRRRIDSASLRRPAQRALISRNESPLPESPRKLRRRFLRLRRQHEQVLQEYYSLGTSYSEPISSMMYSLASELGREDNDILWLTIVGVTSMEMYGRSSRGVGVIPRRRHDLSTQAPSSGWLGLRGAQLRQLLRDEVRRLNPPALTDIAPNRVASAAEHTGVIPTTARSPTDTSIRLSPEPKFLLVRHWSLYDSMLHSPYLAARLHTWTDFGRRRLMKLLAKMGVSIAQSKQSYTHMDMELKRGLREKLLKYTRVYGLDDLVPASGAGASKEGWGFVRSYGWRATLSADDVSVVIGAILEVGLKPRLNIETGGSRGGRDNGREITDADGSMESKEWVTRFFHAYDALEKIEDLKAALPTAQLLHRAILRTGTSLMEKRSIKHLRAFRMCIVKDGPDVPLFTHPAALTKLALWIGEAIAEVEQEKKGRRAGRATPLVVATLHEARGVYVVVGTGGGDEREVGVKAKAERGKEKAHKATRRAEKKGKNRRVRTDEEDTEAEPDTESDESSDSDDTSDDDDADLAKQKRARGYGRNRFGNAFQEVVEETGARVRIDSFEHCVVEVRKEDLAGFLEGLCDKVVVG